MPDFRKVMLLTLAFTWQANLAQHRVLDSLNQVFATQKVHDTTRLLILATELGGIGRHDPDWKPLNDAVGELAKNEYDKQPPGALRNKYASYLAVYYNNLGANFAALRDAPNTIRCIDKSVALFQSAKMYDEMYVALISKAIFLSQIKEYEKAIGYVFRALHYFERDKANKQEGILYAQSTLARIYSDFGKYRESIAFDQKVIAFYENRHSLSPDDTVTLATSYVNSGSSYLNLNELTLAEAQFLKALQQFENIGDANNRSVTLTKLALVKIAGSKFSEAETLLTRSLEHEIGPVYEANANVKFGLLYVKMENFRKADAYLSKGLEISQQNGAFDLQEEAAELLYETSRKNGDLEKALQMHELHDRLEDASRTEAAKNALAQHQLRSDFEKKEMQYRLRAEKRSATQKNWLIAASGALLLLLLGAAFYYRNSRQKQAIAALEKGQMRQKLLLSQMNPHFIFNSLQNIRALIRGQRNDEAVDYLGKFSRLTRQILENSGENHISLAEETEMIRNYMSVQQLLYAESFVFTVDVSPEIEPEHIFIPPMLTQPFIENAIRHGIFGMEGGKIAVSFMLRDERLFVNISDNGRGFDAHAKPKDHKSMATSIVAERLAYYAKNRPFPIRSENLSDAGGRVCGARVTFEIPYLYEN